MFKKLLIQLGLIKPKTIEAQVVVLDFETNADNACTFNFVALIGMDHYHCKMSQSEAEVVHQSLYGKLSMNNVFKDTNGNICGDLSVFQGES